MGAGNIQKEASNRRNTLPMIEFIAIIGVGSVASIAGILKQRFVLEKKHQEDTWGRKWGYNDGWERASWIRRKTYSSLSVGTSYVRNTQYEIAVKE